MTTKEKKISDKTVLKASAMIEQLDKLAVERDEFERTDMARTNKKLYELLGTVYERYLETAASETVLKLTVKGLVEILKKRDKPVQKKQHRPVCVRSLRV